MNRCPVCVRALEAVDPSTGLRICNQCRGAAIALKRLPLPASSWHREVVVAIEIAPMSAQPQPDAWRAQHGAFTALDTLDTEGTHVPEDSGKPRCLDCTAPFETHILRAQPPFPEELLLLCRRCEHAWLEAGMYARLAHRGRSQPRAKVPARRIETSQAPREQHPAMAKPMHERLKDGDDVLRIPMSEPISRIAALPLAFLCAALMRLTSLGTMLLFPFAIQFHELGHATFAWLSGRFAVPIPCGLTIWFESQTWFFELLLLASFAGAGYVAVREKRFGFGALLLGFFAAHIVLRSMAPERSLGLAVAGGFVGEIVFPALVLVFFPVALPERLRWDFFRYLAVIPAAGTLILSYGTWSRAMHEGGSALPRGSFLGSGAGDIERMIDDLDFPEASIAPFFHSAWWLAMVIITLTYLPPALLAARTLMQRQQLR